MKLHEPRLDLDALLTQKPLSFSFAPASADDPRTARALFRDCGADAFGGALNGRDVRLLGESEFRNITALAGGVIQSTGEAGEWGLGESSSGWMHR